MRGGSFGAFPFFIVMEKEIWKPVVGYEGVYEVSNKGRIKSVERIVDAKNHKIHKRESIRNLKIHNGYYYITLSKNSKNETLAVHRIVAMAFLDKPNEKNHIDHINTNRLDNRVENLKWCTRLENARNPITRQNVILAHKNESYLKKAQMAKIISGKAKIVYKYSVENKYIESYESISNAARSIRNTNFKSVRARISLVLDKENNVAYGYKWRSQRIEPTQ
jgi:hypothetical protein